MEVRKVLLITDMQILRNISMMNGIRNSESKSFVCNAEAILDTFIALFYSITLSVVFNLAVETMIFLIVFLILRHVTIGYCAKSYVLFFLGMSAILGTLFGLLIFLPGELLNQLTILLSLLAVALVLRFGIITPKEKTETYEQAVRFQRNGRITITVFAVSVILTTFHSGYLRLAFAGAYAMVLTGILLYVKTIQHKQANRWHPPVFWVSLR